jgi:catechol 2,3-dioxygenase-like lactoylglutathione lyase family enzyme
LPTRRYTCRCRPRTCRAPDTSTRPSSAYPSWPWADRNPATPTCAAGWCIGPGAGTLLSLYERPISPAEHTAAFFVVDDFDQTLVELRSRGLALADYDLPHIKTQDGVLSPANAGRRAWFHDPDGNVLGLFEQPFLTPG